MLDAAATLLRERGLAGAGIQTLFVFVNLDGHASIGHVQGGRNMNSLRGKTLRWTFTDGPVAGTLFEHTFHDDGSVVWRVLDGQGKGASAHEKRYATTPVTEDVHTVSYLAASGHTLTVVLNLATGVWLDLPRTTRYGTR
jgi:hypothetical protein